MGFSHAAPRPLPFSPRWKEPEVEDGKHGQLEHKRKRSPPPHGLISGLFKKGTTPRESVALITLSSREEFHRRTAVARNSCLLPRSKPVPAYDTVSRSNFEALSSSPISHGVKAKTMRRHREKVMWQPAAPIFPSFILPLKIEEALHGKEYHLFKALL